MLSGFSVGKTKGYGRENACLKTFINKIKFIFMKWRLPFDCYFSNYNANKTYTPLTNKLFLNTSF